jgi:hypothetical protein
MFVVQATEKTYLPMCQCGQEGMASVARQDLANSAR